MTLLRRVERYLRHAGVRPTTFGREAANDANLVFDLRCGRECRSPLTRRIEAYLEAAEHKLAGAKCRR